MSEPTTGLSHDSTAITAAVTATAEVTPTTRAVEAQRLAQLRDNSISDATWSTYLGAWSRWATWAGAHNRPTLPADPHDLGAWAHDSVYPPTGQPDLLTGDTATRTTATTSVGTPSRKNPTGISAATLTKWMAAVVFIHRRAGHPSPLQDPALNSVLRGLRRVMVDQKPPRRQNPALMTEHVDQILATIDSSPTQGRSLVEVRDRALILLAFSSAMRASELAALNIDDLEPDTGGLIVRVRSTRTDHEGAATFLTIPWARRPHRCPVHAVDDWLNRLDRQLTVQDPTHTTFQDDASAAAAANPDPHPNPAVRRSLTARRALVTNLQGAVLRSIFRNGRVGSTTTPNPHHARMARLAITKTITARARATGLQAPDAAGPYYSAHSTRAGFATQAADNGVSERDIMEHGRWKSVQAARNSIRRADLFNDHNAAGHLGL